jgi:hypothetical protein
MSEISVVTVAKVIEGALEGDIQKVKSYAELIADNLYKNGDERAAKIIRSKLDGSYKTQPKIVTMDSR